MWGGCNLHEESGSLKLHFMGHTYLALKKGWIVVADLVEFYCHLGIDSDPHVVVHHLGMEAPPGEDTS